MHNDVHKIYSIKLYQSQCYGQKLLNPGRSKKKELNNNKLNDLWFTAMFIVYVSISILFACPQWL